jgi:hypothetical protein
MYLISINTLTVLSKLRLCFMIRPFGRNDSECTFLQYMWKKKLMFFLVLIKCKFWAVNSNSKSSNVGYITYTNYKLLNISFGYFII